MVSSDFFRPAGLLANVRLDDIHVSTTLVFLVSVALAYYVAQTTYRLWFHPLAKLPGPLMYRISYVPFLYENHYKGLFFRRAASLLRQYGPMVRVGPDHVLLDASIAWPQVFARRKAGEDEFYKMGPTDRYEGDGLAFAPRDVHRRQRKRLSHAFSDAALVQQESTIRAHVDQLLVGLREQARRGADVEIISWMVSTSFDIIGDLTFSESFRSLENNTAHEFLDYMTDNIRQNDHRRLYEHFPLMRTVLACFDSSFGLAHHPVRNFTKAMALKRMRFGEAGPLGRDDFSTYMLRKPRSESDTMTKAEILANVPLLITAGSETISTALAGLWFYLPKYPRAFKRLTDEIRTAFRSDDEITFITVAHLEYLCATITEILRFYTPNPEVPARVSPGGFVEGVYLPRGTRISTYQWATLRNPKHFTDPDTFVPERWLPPSHPFHEARYKHDNHDIFKPFSYGPRDCIGKNLAMNELRLIVSRFLFAFDYDLLDGQDDWHTNQNSHIIWDKGPLSLRLRERDVAA